MIQFLLLLGMTILIYLVFRMTYGYTQMIKELKYLRSKIHSGQSFTEESKKLNSPKSKKSKKVLENKVSKQKDDDNKDDTQNKGGGTNPEPQQEEASTTISNLFNTFHLPIQNYVPILKSINPQNLVKNDIYESYNNYVLVNEMY